MEVVVDDMWTPYKEFQRVVETAISRPSKETFEVFESALQKHRQNFLTLLKNPPKNEKHREELNKGTVDGIELPGLGRSVLPKELVAEAIIISDMYELNEYMALDLLGTAQQHMANYPGLARGVVAVLLYYDGRKSLVMTLRCLVQARLGNLWTVETTSQVSQAITRYTEELLNDGIITKLLSLIESLDIRKEIELLQKNRALGPPRYHQQVIELFESTRQTLAEIIYLYAAQSGLPKEPTLSLLSHLRETKPQDDYTGGQSGIDVVTLILEIALLYALDLSLLHREDGEVVQKRLPLVAKSDKGQFLAALQNELSSGNSKPWACPGLHALTLMGWSLTLSNLRLVPQLMPQNVTLDIPDVIMEAAIQAKVFYYLNNTFLMNEVIYKEEFYLRRMHNLLTDFISQMPQKVKEMRLRAEETDRTVHAYMNEGLEPPANLLHNFEQLLLSLSRLYHVDPLNLELELDYWCPPESFHVTTFPYRAQPKQASLYSFVVQTGEVLPPTLFVPYLRMLSSLASCPRGAAQCFALLKNNENKNLSWEHFFSSLNRYFNNLRQERLPTTDTVYRHRVFNKGITPQEVQGLHAVLDLIKVVAENDVASSEAFSQTVSWSAVTVLLGLVTCSVQLPLKAQLLNTLAALSKSPTTSAALWHNLEASQIISTIPSTSTYQPRGIQTEIEEIECRNEEYPLTRSVLKFLSALTDKPMPKFLGASSRTPGFDPYLNFILNSILLRFKSRSYKDPKEKWEVCDLCMGLVCKLLMQYDPSSDEFLAKHVQAYSLGTAQVNPPPGYHIMISLCSKSELLRMILLLLDEGCRLLDAYTSFPGKNHLESSLLSCLQTLEHALAIQPAFLAGLNAGNSNLLLMGLNRLILGINDVTNKPDHLLNVAKFVTYQSWLPSHALPAVNILLLITSYPTPPAHLLSIFTSTPALKTSIRHGFVSCLEAEEEDIEDNDGLVWDNYDVNKRVITKTKMAICKLLLQCLNQAVPNVAHYLFGFDLNKEIKKTVFQQPGVLGMPRSCLHSILCLLNSSLVNSNEISPCLLEMYYRIIHALAANPRTSEPTLRFLRSSCEFLRRHLAALPFQKSRNGSDLNQMAWLLKTVGIEMRVTAVNQQLSQLAGIVEIFAGSPSQAMNGADTTQSADTLSQSILSTTQVDKFKPKEQLVLRLVKYADFHAESVVPPNLEYFDLRLVEKALRICEIDEDKLKLIDVKKLHQLLNNDLKILQSNRATVGQHLVKEVQDLLIYAAKLNESRQYIVANARFLDAWRQATEVMFAVATRDALHLEQRFNLLIDIIHELLVKAVSVSSQTEIATIASGAILLLCVDLRQNYISELGKGEETDSKLSVFMDSNQHKFTSITTNIVKWILASGVSSQTLRANLYAALLNFLHLNRERWSVSVKLGGRSVRWPHQGSNGGLNGSQYVTMLDDTVGSNISAVNRRLGRMASDHHHQLSFSAQLDAILSYGDRLVDMLCHDCASGHDICKMLALSCLDMLVELDTQGTWTSILSARGYLKFTIDSLLDADRHLVALLTTNIKSLRPLYVYESKMALLCRVASTPAGAELLLEHTTLACLSALHVFNKHPEIVPHQPVSTEIDFVPTVSARYLQVLSPALSLCDTIISSLGVGNHQAITQVLKFILCNGEMVTLVLRSGSPFHQLCYLKELALLTGVIARATNEDVIKELGGDRLDPGGVMESTSLFNRIQKFMFALISRFVISESLLRDIEADTDPNNKNPKARSEVVLTFVQIVAHLMLYARNLVSSSSVDRRVSSVVFQPALSDSIHLDRREVLTMQEATLGVIVQQLVQAVAHHRKEKGNLDLCVRRLQSVPEMSTDKLKECLPESFTTVTELDECRRMAMKLLSEQVDNKYIELDYTYFIIENCLYIVWSHLDYYMLRGISSKTLGIPKPSSFDHQILEYGVTWNVTSEDLNHLKQGLLSVFNDTFSKTLVSTAQDMSPTDKGFLEALLRRIKKLIQFVPNS